MVGLGGLFFLLHGYLPLRPNDLWVHVAWGREILGRWSLPTTDPVAPLAEGMRVVNGEWLSQVVLAAVERLAGPEGLKVLFALAVTATYLVLGRACWLMTRSKLLAGCGVALALGIGLSRLTTLRPETFAALCFAVLLWLLVATGDDDRQTLHRPRLFWLGLPLLFVVWANLHGSWPAGIAVLGCLFIGRALETLWRRRSLRAVLEDRPTRRWLVATELAFAASLVNPYGIDLPLHILGFGSNTNLAAIIEWRSLDLGAWGGREFGLSWVLLLLVARLSRRRVPIANMLMLAVFSYGVVTANRMIAWYAPLFAWGALPHLEEILGRTLPGWRERLAGVTARLATRGLTHRVWLALSLLLLWATFALSPLSRPLFGRRPPTARELHGPRSPIELAQHLRRQPPRGLVWSPQEWSDFLTYAGPPGLRPMISSMIHLIPQTVWQDYLRIHHNTSGWPLVLDIYAIDTVVFDKTAAPGQTELLRRSPEWLPSWESESGVVFRRQPHRATTEREDQEGSA
jgi:hypothetical protein